MTRALSCIAKGEDEGMRMDSFLASRDCYASRSAAAKRIEAGDVFVNGKLATKKMIVTSGDVVVYEEMPEQAHIPLHGEPIPLDVRFEDDYLMVISKQAGLCVHPSPGHSGATLVNALIYRFGRDHLAHIQGDDRPGIVHRLDMDTSGLMLCAKNDATGNALQDAIRLRQVDRRYLTLVHGNIAMDTGMIDRPIARSDRDRLRMRVSDKPGARSSITTFSVLERFEAGVADEGYTLLECKLYTGRTHQIRVHMQYIQHCCVGDPVYSAGKEKAQLGLERQFLHSYSLNFDHPDTGEHLEFVDALPPDLQKSLDSLEERSMGKTEVGARILGALVDAPRQSLDVQL